MTIGIDEVGRGCWAGPLLVVAARGDQLPEGLADSKTLSKKRRISLLDELGTTTCEFGEGWVTPQEIDSWGLTKAMQVGVDRALTALDAVEDELIIMDGVINYCDPKFLAVECVARADNIHPIVSAASIYAKVHRDQVMTAQAIDYPEYGFENHVGYGTAAHIAALKRYGVTPLHRTSYKPVAKLARK